MKQEKLMLPPQEIDMSDIARTVLLGHGVRGVKLTVEAHPSGSRCTVDGYGTVNIVIDPEQLKNSYGEVPPEHIQAAAAHEVGHALFELALPGVAFASVSRKDSFFQCLVQDTIIDASQTRIPALAAPIRGLYKDVILPTDFSKQALCSQFMYGIRIGQVLGTDIAIAPEVSEAIEALRHYQAANGKEFNLLDVLTDKRTDPTKAMSIANRYIKPVYDAFAEQDKQNNPDQGSTSELGEAPGQCGHTQPADTSKKGEDEQQTNQHATAPDTLPDIAQQIQEAAEEAKHRSEENSPENSDEQQQKDEEEAAKQERAARAGNIKAELQLDDADADAYLSALEQYGDTIQDVTKVILQLTRPATDRQRLSYTRQRAGSGAVLHHDLTNLLVSDITQQSYPFWRNIERQARRRAKTFDGLDIHFLCDVSDSMRISGAAEYAATTGVCLTEGLDLARHQAKKLSRSEPDVRSHIVAFGSGTKELAPLSNHSNPVHNGRMFTALRNARSGGTHVSEAIESCLGTTSGRDSIIIAISDGNFHDHGNAQHIVNSLPANTYFAQLLLENYRPITALTENNQKLQDPRQLPYHLLMVLQQFIQRYE